MKKQYIKAVTQLLLQGKDINDVLTHLHEVLAKKGHLTIHLQILQGILLELGRVTQDTAPTVVVAKAADADALKKSIEKALETLGALPSEAVISTDTTLVGGFVASHNGQLIDKSYKQKLVTLYRSITN